MQIHLIKTPDYALEDFLGVIDILHSFPGPATFVSSQHVFAKEEFYFLSRDRERGRGAAGTLEKHMYIVSMGMPLSWKELFGLCKSYREVAHVNDRLPVFILAINNTESENIAVFDYSWNEMLPPHRKFIKIGETNAYYSTTPDTMAGITTKKDGFTFINKHKMKYTQP